jgi:CHAT domain-containing protein
VHFRPAPVVMWFVKLLIVVKLILVGAFLSINASYAASLGYENAVSDILKRVRDQQYDSAVEVGLELLSQIDSTILDDAKAKPYVVGQLPLSLYANPVGLIVGAIATIGDIADSQKRAFGEWDSKLYPNKYFSKIDRALSKVEQRDLFRSIGVSAYQLRRFEVSAKFLGMYIELEESFRLTFLREDMRTGYISSYYRDIAMLVDSLIKLGRGREALVYSEKSKSKTLSEILLESHYGKENNKTLIEAKISRAQLEAVAAKEFLSEGDKRTLSMGPTKAPVDDFGAFHVINNLVFPVSLNEDNVRTIASNQVVVSYFVSDDRISILFVSSDGQVLAKSVPCDKSELVKLVRGLAVSAQARGAVFYRYSEVLYELLISPIEGELAKFRGKRVLISGHDLLHALPFHALSHNGRFLIQDHPISYTYSLVVYGFQGLRVGKGREAQPNSALIVGDPNLLRESNVQLPGAVREARQVFDEISKESKVFSSVDLLLSDAATKTAVQSKLLNSNFIHLATHSYFDTRNPDNSAIFLGPDIYGDGRLTAKEIYRMKFSRGTNIMILSSCESGASQVKPGDDLYGLTRSLTISGATTIVSTYWPIEDEDGEIYMRLLYRNLAKGAFADFPKAIQDTSIEMIAMGKLSWVAYKVEGLPSLYYQ